MFTTKCTGCGKPVECHDSMAYVVAKYGEQCPPCSDRLAGERHKAEMDRLRRNGQV